MKSFFALCLSVLLAVSVFSPAAAETAEESTIVCAIENGSYVVRIPAAEDDAGWAAAVPEGDSALKMGEEKTEDGFYTVRFDPAADGTATVTVRHFYCDIACDQVHTWDLKVEGGAVTESTGGSYTASPSEEELDALISGEWAEKETQFTRLTLQKNPENGWDAEFSSPLTRGAFVLQAAACYDCETGAFLYDKGFRYDAPVEGEELGAPVSEDAEGCIIPEGSEEEGITLRWVDRSNPDAAVIFERVQE